MHRTSNIVSRVEVSTDSRDENFPKRNYKYKPLENFRFEPNNLKAMYHEYIQSRFFDVTVGSLLPCKSGDS